jgi:hypothetical protein
VEAEGSVSEAQKWVGVGRGALTSSSSSHTLIFRPTFEGLAASSVTGGEGCSGDSDRFPLLLPLPPAPLPAAAAAMLFGRAMLPCFASTLGGNFADGFDDDPAAGFLPKNEKRFACFMIPGLGPLGLGGRDRATKSANFVM